MIAGLEVKGGRVPRKVGTITGQPGGSRCEQVVATLKQDIISQRLRPGDVLPSEEDLAKQLGVSRPLCREALTILKAQGYLEARRGVNGGTFVKDLIESRELGTMLLDLILMGRLSVQDLGNTRLLVEPRAAQLAAQNASSKDLQKLNDLTEATLKVADRGQRLALETEFHVTIGELSGNPFYAFLIRNLLAFSDTFLAMCSTEAHNGEETHNPFAHREIMTALLSRSPEAAYEQMYIHVSQTKTVLMIEERKLHNRR